MTEKDNATQIAVMANNIQHIVDDIAFIRVDINEIKSRYVSKDEYEPVKKVVYGIVTLILTAVVGAIVAIVLKQ